MHFEKAGEKNTQKTLEIAIECAKKRGIKYIVVASTTGATGALAAKMLKDSGIKLIVVTHNTGFGKEGEQEFSKDFKSEIENLGASVYTGTMVLRGLGTAIRNKLQYSEQEIINSTLRMFSQGIKVCVEIVAMTSDAGLISTDDVIAIAGTAKGADTACIIKPNSSNRFFDIKINEILCKPKEF